MDAPSRGASFHSNDPFGENLSRGEIRPHGQGDAADNADDRHAAAVEADDADDVDADVEEKEVNDDDEDMANDDGDERNVQNAEDRSPGNKRDFDF